VIEREGGRAHGGTSSVEVVIKVSGIADRFGPR
jgi:hypothetical protein